MNEIEVLGVVNSAPLISGFGPGHQKIHSPPFEHKSNLLKNIFLPKNSLECLFFSFILLIFDADAATCTKNTKKHWHRHQHRFHKHTRLIRIPQTDGPSFVSTIFIFFFNPFQSTLSRHFWGLGVVVVVVVVVVVAATRPVVVEVSLHAGQFAMDVKIAAGLSWCQSKPETATCQHF